MDKINNKNKTLGNLKVHLWTSSGTYKVIMYSKHLPEGNNLYY